eukprot:4074362-Prymnesium_polylepis.1
MFAPAAGGLCSSWLGMGGLLWQEAAGALGLRPSMLELQDAPEALGQGAHWKLFRRRRSPSSQIRYSALRLRHLASLIMTARWFEGIPPSRSRALQIASQVGRPTRALERVGTKSPTSPTRERRGREGKLF